MPPSDAPSVLVLFNTVALYGMERAVIEYFDLVRAELGARFLISRSAERLDLPVFREIRRRGFDVRFFSDREDWPKIGRPRSIAHLLKLAAAMVRGNRDVLRASRGCAAIYAPSVSYLYFALVAAPWFRLLGRHVIYHFHDLAPHPGWVLRIASPLITDVIHNTEEGRRRIALAFPTLARARHVVIPSRTEHRGGALSPDMTDALSSGPNVVFVGQVSRHKGIDLLIDALAVLPRGDRGRLHVCGEASDGAFLRQMQERARSAGLDVRWWGYVSDVHAVLEKADVYVHPTPPSRFQESFGRGIAEAMRAGVPTVCFRSGAVAELVAHDETGWICEREDAASLAGAITLLMRDPERRRRLGASARCRFEEAYSDRAIRRASDAWLAAWKTAAVAA
jgi:glycosyltransferase involved in cell wall biosynthesis